MREIKFKIWDNTKNQMFFQKEHKFLILPGKETPKDFENVELLQFTGLKDKNGMEIYEGDIVEFGGGNHQIEFDRGCFYMAQYEGSDMVPWLLDIKYNEMATVLGNIYENPELITK